LAAEAGWASTVVLVRPANPTAITAEALVRMHGELVSAGFDVEIKAATAGGRRAHIVGTSRERRERRRCGRAAGRQHARFGRGVGD